MVDMDRGACNRTGEVAAIAEPHKYAVPIPTKAVKIFELLRGSPLQKQRKRHNTEVGRLMTKER